MKRDLRPGIFFLIPLAMVGIFSLVAAPTAKASVTYTYTGNSFTSINGSIGVTLSDHISITFSVATALAPNLSCADVERNGVGQLLSFSITDAVHSFGLGPNTQVFCISTSSTGQITQWIVGDFVAGAFPFMISTNIPSTGNVHDISALTAGDFAEIRNNPGIWSQGPAPPPAPLPPDTLVQICLGKNVPGPNFCDLGNDQVSVHKSSISISDTFGSSVAGAQLTGAAAGAARFGVLRASSSATFTISGTPGGHAFSHAISTFEDLVTISFGPFNGSTGTLVVTYTLTGSPSSSGTAVGLGMVEGNVNGHAFVQQYKSPVSGLFVAGAFPFVYGQQFRQVFQLAADSGTIIANGTPGDICVFCSGSGSASANFLNTFVLSGFEVLDPSGNPLPSAPTITSSSGTQYSMNGVLTSFADLSVKDLGLEKFEGEFEIEGSFSLGAGSNGIDPLHEDVALQIGTFSTVIPAGSFKLEGHTNRDNTEDTDRDEVGRFRFEGTINGARLEIQIRSSSEGTFTFEAEGHGADLTGTVKPVKVRLMIGDDGGTTTFNAESN